MTIDLLRDDACGVRVQALARDAIRVTHALPQSGRFPDDPAWLGDVLAARDPELPAGPARASASLANGVLEIRDADGRLVLAEDRPVEFGRGVKITFRLAPKEVLYGWGEQFGAFARTQGRLSLNAFNTPSFLQRHRSYSAIPLFVSRRGYAVLMLNGFPARWHIDGRRHRLGVQTTGGAADYLVILGRTPKDILRTYTGLTGRPPLLPRWAHGLWATGYPQEPEARVLELAREHRRRGIPLDVIILDYHWEEAFHNFRWRRSLFPDPDRLLRELRALGVRLGLILTPFVNRENIPLAKRVLNWRLRNVPASEMAADERALPEYEECRRAGLLAHPRVWWWFGRGGMLDFTHRLAAAWWAGKLQALVHQGVAFFKNDDGEYLPDTAASAGGLSGAEHHNLYGFYYGRATYQAVEQVDDRRPIVYARSVWAGSQRYPGLFLGDQTPTFGHMQGTLRAGLNLGLAGFAYWTADVFGLDGRTTMETHMRYAQWALFAPIARYFWRPPEIDPTRFPWSHGERAESNFRRLLDLRRRLLPYYRGLGWEAFQTGSPLLRPMMLEFPDDERFALTDDQLMIGDCLLLAPVLRPGASARTVVLPHGLWHDLWGEATWRGAGSVSVPAPLDRVPLLARGGCLLPMLPPAACESEAVGYPDLELHLWPPYGGRYTVREEDGQSRAYLRGECAETSILVDPSADGIVLRVSPLEGALPGLPSERRWELVLHRVGSFTAARQLPSLQPCPVEQRGSEARLRVEFLAEQGCTVEIAVEQAADLPRR